MSRWFSSRRGFSPKLNSRFLKKIWKKVWKMDLCAAIWSCGIFTTILGLWFLKSRKVNPGKIAGVYSQPGKYYWVKVLTFYLLIKFRQWKSARNQVKGEERKDAGYGAQSRGSLEEMDKIQRLDGGSQAIDAVYFNGANAEGFQIVSGMARRPHEILNGFLIFRIPKLGVLVSPKFPDTIIFGGSEEYYGAEGFRYSCKVPMKHWKLQYDGNLKLHGIDSKEFKVKLTADWTSSLPHFDFDCMIPAWTMARAIAKETWSREYFEILKSAHQTHYEQHGNLQGEIDVEGSKFKFDMPSMRDHSYSTKRDWKLLHRYMMHMFSLQDGRRFNIGIVSQPVTCSELELGYMYEADGTLHAIESITPNMYVYGENGVLPEDYAIHIRVSNGKEYVVQIQVLETQELHIGWEWEARIVERRCKFNIDGIEGYGISECHYRNVNGRPEAYSKNDPEWVNPAIRS